MNKSLIFCLLAITLSGLGQNWLVLASHKQNKLCSRKQFSLVEMGTLISDRDTLQVADSGYVSVLHISGAVFEFTEKGLYTIKNLKIDSSFAKSSSMFSFEDFKEMRTHITGVRYRDLRYAMMHVTEVRPISVFLEKTIIDWHYSFEKKNYLAKLVQYDETLLEIPLLENKPFEINLENTLSNTNHLDEPFVLMISPSNSDYFADRRQIHILDQNTKGKGLYDQIKKAESLYTHLSTSAVENYMLGLIYYKNNLHFKAVQAFKRAHMMHPKVNQYTLDYHNAAYI